MQQLAPSPSQQDWPPHGLVSLWDMLKFYASRFVTALDDISAIRAMAVMNKGQHLDEQTAESFVVNLRTLGVQLHMMGLTLTRMSVLRLAGKIEEDRTLDARAEHLLSEIHLRLEDELDQILLFSIPVNAHLYEQADPIFGSTVESSFRAALFDIEEAGKCLALRRSTGCVFHLMRIVEVGIDGARKCLGIPDPVKDAQRNWGAVLRKFKDEMERRNGAQPVTWTGGDAQFFSEVYASLDAVKQAWRNPTMHVESKYSEEEAEHILAVVKGFMKKLASRLDENGQPLA